MSHDTTTRAQIAALIFIMINAVLFGAGLIVVLLVPALNANTDVWIAVVIAVSLILSVPFAWAIAPRLRARYWRFRSSDPLHIA